MHLSLSLDPADAGDIDHGCGTLVRGRARVEVLSTELKKREKRKGGEESRRNVDLWFMSLDVHLKGAHSRQRGIPSQQTDRFRRQRYQCRHAREPTRR